MKIKTHDLIGAALDWVVATAVSVGRASCAKKLKES